jgi:hypothetical protein
MLKHLPVLLIVLFSLFLGGCFADRDYAVVRKNFAINTMFRAGKVLPEYRYYYNGPDAEPLALLALDRSYRLEAKFWTEIDLTDAKLRNWIKEFDRLTGDYDDIGNVRIDYNGQEILTKDGTRIGLLYARYDWVIAWFGEGKVITVTGPQASSLQHFPVMRRGNY